MANKLEGSPSNPSNNPTAAGLRAGNGLGVGFLENPNEVDLENVPGRDDEVGDGADVGGAPVRPVGVEVVGLDGGEGRDEVGGGVGDEAPAAVLDPRWSVRRLECCIAHVAAAVAVAGAGISRTNKP